MNLRSSTIEPKENEPLVIQVIDEAVRGSDEIAREEFEQAIAKSLVAVERNNFTKSKLAALTNLCIDYTMPRQFEEAIGFATAPIGKLRRQTFDKSKSSSLQ